MSIDSSLYGINLSRKEVEFMREVTVNFTIYDENEERLRKITEGYKKLGWETTEDKMFETIMLTGSTHDIDAKLKFHEWKLGLREDFR